MSSARAIRSVFEGKKVLVTGHTGFKGSWLSEWLVRLGAKVTGLSLPGEYRLFDQMNLAKRINDRRGDICDLFTINEIIYQTEPDFVFHLAAQALVRASYTNPLKTHATNVLGTANLLESMRIFGGACVVVCVTTDKVYRNRETDYAYREDDPLGGHDPYSASKAAAEIVIASYRDSFFSAGHPVRVASARAGNVIGGGDWAQDRLVPDCIRALEKKESIAVRNPDSTRPWQHVLEPLGGYLTLATALRLNPENSKLAGAFNFGPGLSSNRSVHDLVAEILKHWPGASWNAPDPTAPHEAGRLNLATDKALHLLGWKPAWDFEKTVARTVDWYQGQANGSDAVELCREQIEAYERASVASTKSSS